MSRLSGDARSIRSRNRPPITPIPAEQVVIASALPAGASTAARQDTGNESLATLAATDFATAANQETAIASLAAIEVLLATLIDDGRRRGFEPSESVPSFLVGAS